MFQWVPSAIDPLAARRSQGGPPALSGRHTGFDDRRGLRNEGHACGSTSDPVFRNALSTKRYWLHRNHHSREYVWVEFESLCGGAPRA